MGSCFFNRPFSSFDPTMILCLWILKHSMVIVPQDFRFEVRIRVSKSMDDYSVLQLFEILQQSVLVYFDPFPSVWWALSIWNLVHFSSWDISSNYFPHLFFSVLSLCPWTPIIQMSILLGWLYFIFSFFISLLYFLEKFLNFTFQCFNEFSHWFLKFEAIFIDFATYTSFHN